MNRLAAFPLATLCLLFLWLLLNQTLSLGHALFGTALAFIGSQILSTLEIPKGRLRRLASIGQLGASVFADIIASNAAVAFLILGFRRRRGSPGFVEIPIELRDPYGLSALACIITSTPGTVWVGFDDDGGILTIHVLDLVDRADWVRTIKERYERPLAEIFA